MCLKRYPRYKSTLLTSLGKIPDTWEEKRAKYFFSEIDERSNTGSEEMLSVSHLRGVVRRKLLNVSMFQSESNAGQKICQPGDVVINTMWAWMSALGVAKERGIVSPSYGIYRPHLKNAYHPDYLDNLLRTEAYRIEYVCRSTGIRSSRLRLYPDKFLDMHILCPPYQDQVAIVQFLNLKKAQINKLILKKKRLIELLKEQKQAIIKKTVTSGLNQNVRLKSNSIEWLSDIPEHWEIQKLKTLTKFQNGFAFKPSDWKDSGIPIIRIQNLNGSHIYNYVDKGKYNAPKIDEDDLLFAWSGNRGTSFGSFLWNNSQSGYLNQHIFKLIDYDLDKSFFYFALRAVTSYVEQKASGIIGMVHITKPELGSITMPVPPKNEQKAIGQYLKQKTELINQLIINIEKLITYIQEYRTRLISDVVTGQIDVRNIEIGDIVEEELIEDDLEEEQEEESLELVGACDDD